MDRHMKCPWCTTQIEVDNSVNTMEHYCPKCKKYWDPNYLYGFWDGYEKDKEEK